MTGLRIKSRLITSFAGVLLLAVVGLVPLLLAQISSTIMRAETRELEGYDRAFASAVSLGANAAAGMASLVAGIPDVQEAFAAGDRGLLSRWFVPGFDQLKSQFGIDQFQFHTPPATSFLRVHMPAKFGDDLSSFRQTVVEANKTHRIVSGLESGVAGLGMRGVVPVSSGAVPVGTVEIGLAVGRSFLDSFKKNYGVDAAIYVRDDKVAGGYKPLASTYEKPFFAAEDWGRALAGDTIVRQGEREGLPVAALTAPLRDYSGKPAAVVEIIMDARDYNAEYAQARTIALAVVGGVLAIGLSVAWLLARSVSAPLLDIAATMHRLADGDSLVVVPHDHRHDEVGDMARAVTVFKQNALDKQRVEAEAERRRAQEDASRTTRDLAASSHAQSVQEKVGRVDAATNGIRRMAGDMCRRSERNGSLSLEMGDAARITSQRAAVVSDAARQLSQAVDEIAQQVSHAHDISRKAVDGVDGTARQMHSLTQTVQSIGQVVELISDIAAQTNLLALNATIEAARAGDAGKGFAVVANEVKQLANQTARATEDITQKVSEIQHSTASMSESFSEVGDVIRSLDEVASAIAGAVQEQDAATREISENVAHVSDQADIVAQTVQGVAVSSAKTSAGTVRVIWSAQSLTKIVTELTGETAEFMDKLHESER